MKIHPKFRINGNQFNSKEELLGYAKPLDVDLAVFLKNWLEEGSFISVKTSGSTGIPKEINLKKEYMVNSAKATASFFGLKEGANTLLCMSIQYIAGKMMVVRAMVLGWNLDVVEPSSNPLKNLEKNYDFCAMVPLQVSSSISELYKIKTLIVGGGLISKSLIKKLQTIPTQVYATYGMTETITHIAIQKINNFKTKSEEDSKISIFKTLPNVKVQTDSRGCLVIHAPLIADEKIVTNDLVQLISDTEFKWIGRFDNVINSGGVKLYPELIEEKLAEIIKNRFFIASEPDDIYGEKVILIIESPSLPINQIKRLENEIKRKLQKFEVPKSIYFVEVFVETETKKIQRLKTLDVVFNQYKN